MIAVLQDHPAFNESILFLLSGFGLVLLTLAVLAMVTQLIGWLFVRCCQNHQDQPLGVRISPAAPEEVEGPVLAAIAAAVHAVYGQQVRLTRVRPVASGQRWTQEGRQNIHSSHNIRSSTERSRGPFKRP